MAPVETPDDDSGADWAQIEQCLALTPTQRVRQLVTAVNFVLAGREALAAAQLANAQLALPVLRALLGRGSANSR